MKTVKETIRKMVSYLNNEEYLGGFWLPNIQRPFVWNEGQIERLFDSIMREYPISTLLVWKTKSQIRRRKFIENYKGGLKLADFDVPADSKPKMLVLDGQQRLQSLFIGLKGSYEKKELHFNVLTGGKAAPEDIRYHFKFMDSSKASLPWFKFKDLVYSNEKVKKLSSNIISKFESLSEEDNETIENNIFLVKDVFTVSENIVYQELDSIDAPDMYSEEDVVEIFIRANSGGTVLGKSDLLFSLLSAVWEDADERLEELLTDLNKTGYKFDRDFVLKTCLTLLGKGAAYNINKFRDDSTRKTIIESWDSIADAIRDVKDFIYGKTFIRSDKALSSYLVLIPLIYYRYHYKNMWVTASDIDEYILRTLLSGSFSGNPDYLIDLCTKQIDKDGDLIVKHIFGVIREAGRSLEITENSILEQHYTSRNIHLIFNMWYRGFNYHPSYANNSPQLDHIFPQSLLKSIKIPNPETGVQNMLKYHWFERDEIANMMLLTQFENGPSGKVDIAPEEWFNGKSDDYLDLHLIPKDPELWKLANYERFIEERRKLILDKFKPLLLKS